MATIAQLDVVLQLKDRDYRQKLASAMSATSAAGGRLASALLPAAAGFATAASAITVATVAVGKFAEAGADAHAAMRTFGQNVDAARSTLESMRERTGGLVSDLELIRRANELWGKGIATTDDELARLVGNTYALERAGLGAADALRRAEGMTRDLGVTAGGAGDEYRRAAVEVRNFVTELQESVDSSPLVTGFMMSLTTALRALRGEYAEVGQLAKEWTDRQAAGMDTQFFPDPSDFVEGTTAARENMVAFMAEMEKFRPSVVAPVAEFNAQMEILEARLVPIAEPAMKLGGALGEVDIAAQEAKKALAFAGDQLSIADVKMQKYKESVVTATQAQRGFNNALGNMASAFGAVSSILGVFGVALPFLSGATGLLGGLSGLLGIGGGGGGKIPKNFKGGMAEGGYIPPGGWAIVGERGPEIMSGPGQITPIGGLGGDTVVHVQLVTQDGRAATDSITVRQRRDDARGRVIRVPLSRMAVVG